MTDSPLATMLITMAAVCCFATLVWWLSFRFGYRDISKPTR